MEALPEALLLEQRASLMEDLSRQHLWAYLPQPFCLKWQFLRLQVQWSHDNTSFSSKKYGRAPCHPPGPVRLLLRAPGSATPTPTMHAFFRCTRWLSIFHRGARPVFTRPSESERERDLSSKPLSFSKERMRERESVNDRREQSRTIRLATLYRGVQPAFTISYRAGAKELKNAIYSPQLFLLRKKDFERASTTGESSRKNLNIFAASGCMLGVKPDNVSASACNIIIINYSPSSRMQACKLITQHAAGWRWSGTSGLVAYRC